MKRRKPIQPPTINLRPTSDAGQVTRGSRRWLDYIYPSAIDLSGADFIRLDGMFVRVYVCVDYPYTVKTGWLDDIINLGVGVEVVQFAQCLDKYEVSNEITHNMARTRFELSRNDLQRDSEVQISAITDSAYIRTNLQGGDELWQMHHLVRVCAESKKTLKVRCREVETTLAGAVIFFRPADYLQAEAFFSTLPLCELAAEFQDDTARNVLTGGLASTYPFNSYEMSDPNGIFIGVNQHNRSAILLDLYNNTRYSNSNMIVLGASGSGKTFTTQVVTHRLRMQGIPVMMICPLKGFEYKPLCDSVGGNYIKLAPGSAHTINIMDIRIGTGERNAAGESGGSLLAAKLQKLHLFFGLMFPDLEASARRRLDRVFITVYEKYGITNDNESIFLSTQDGTFSFRRKTRPMPTLQDIYAEIQGDPIFAALSEMMEPYVSGYLSFFNGSTNVNLENDYIVMDISDIKNTRDSAALTVAMFTALDLFWDRIKEDNTRKKAIVLDELWTLLGSTSNVETAEFVLEIYKTIRSYGGAAIGATQDLGDFMALEDGKYGKGIINAANLRIIHRVEETEADVLTNAIRISEQERRDIVRFTRGQSLLIAGKSHVAMQVEASEKETALITTDRAERLQHQKEREES